MRIMRSTGEVGKLIMFDFEMEDWDGRESI